MVCTDCEKKLRKIVGVDPYRNKAHNKSASTMKSVVKNENKLITCKDRTSSAYERCRICRKLVHQPQTYYCQDCAYQKGICAMCGKKIIDVNKLQLRQSLV